jgi:SAM-dependent methyltransferase
VNKDEILESLKEHPSWYQKIRLPFGLDTPGRDRSQIANQIFPTDLDGASVLDIGCAEGYFSFAAKERNAGRVVGVDIDGDRLATAIRLSRVLGMDIEFLKRSVLDVSELGVFDYVLCLNILHHVTDPINIIHKLVNMTRKKLVLEIGDIGLKSPDIGRLRANKALLGWWGPLLKSLPSALQPSILVVNSRGRFLMTRKWIEHFFQNQHCDVERLEFINSDRPNRYLALVSRRNLTALRFVSGPSSIGKSEFVRRLKSGDLEVSQLLDLNMQDGWQVMTALDLQKSPGVEVNKLALEYNICRPILRRYRDYEFDPALTIERVADKKTAYILVCPSEYLVSRVKEVLNSYWLPMRRHKRRAERLIFEYSQPGRLRKLYDSWISYCKAHGFEVRYIDVSSRKAKAITEELALKLVS